MGGRGRFLERSVHPFDRSKWASVRQGFFIAYGTCGGRGCGGGQPCRFFDSLLISLLACKAVPRRLCRCTSVSRLMGPTFFFSDLDFSRATPRLFLLYFDNSFVCQERIKSVRPQSPCQALLCSTFWTRRKQKSHVMVVFAKVLFIY